MQHSIDMVNNGTETMTFRPEEMVGIVDLRSLGYYKIKQSILQQNLSKYYTFERADKLCEYFNSFVNTLKKGREQKIPEEIDPWLDPSDEQKYMTDQEILDKYIDIESSFFDNGRKESSHGNVMQIQGNI